MLPKMELMSAHLDANGIAFLRGLVRNNDRLWFADRKVIYEEKLRAPFLQIIEEVSAAIEPVAPTHIRPANKMMLRIYRDTRFSSDKRPFKSHIAAWWGSDGMLKTSGAGYYLAISPKEVTLAAGLFMPTPEQLLALRNFIASEQGAKLAAALADKKLRKLLPVTETQSTARVPRGYPADHPNAALLKLKRWGVSTTLPVAQATSPTFVAEVAKAFRAASPLVNLLNQPFAKKKTILF